MSALLKMIDMIAVMSMIVDHVPMPLCQGKMEIDCEGVDERRVSQVKMKRRGKREGDQGEEE